MNHDKEYAIDLLTKMKSNTISNYVIAGLDSSLLENGRVRYFENSRNHEDSITPHNHRFDFACLVLKGSVTNILWTESNEEEGDFFQESRLVYEGKVGCHAKMAAGHGWWKKSYQTYREDEWYFMSANDIHSIQFSRGAKVLFFEGPNISNESMILEPVVKGMVIPTYVKQDYMFRTDLK